MTENQPTKDLSMTDHWVNEAKEGSREAFERLIDVFHKDIFRTVFYRIQSPMDAEDVTQDVFTLAFKNIRQLKEIDRFKSWLYSIAVNRVRDYYRKKRFTSVLGLFSEPDDKIQKAIQEDRGAPNDPLDEMLKKDFWNHLEKAMDDLSKMEKEVFMLRFLDQLGIREISLALAKSESTIKTHLYRSMEKMKNNAILKKIYFQER